MDVERCEAFGVVDFKVKHGRKGGRGVGGGFFSFEIIQIVKLWGLESRHRRHFKLTSNYETLARLFKNSLHLLAHFVEEYKKINPLSNE